jgi:hypothetical protein
MKKVQVPWEIQHRRLSAATTTTLSSKIWMSDTATSLYSTRTREGVAAVWVAARRRWRRERNWEGWGQRLQSRTVRRPPWCGRSARDAGTASGSLPKTARFGRRSICSRRWGGVGPQLSILGPEGQRTKAVCRERWAAAGRAQLLYTAPCNAV